MKKRIFALIGVILLLAMYASTMVFALINSPWAAGMFRISLYCTIVVPVLIYAGMMIYKNAQNRKALPFEVSEQENDEALPADDTETDPDRPPSSVEKR